MLFQSTAFLFIFLPAFFICLKASPRGAIRAGCLLFFSYLFYSGSEPFFVLILIGSSLVDFAAALALGRTTRPGRRKIWLVVSVIVNLGLLGFYKYGGMILPLIAPWGEILGLKAPSLGFYKSFALPAGISFYTFQSMSYTIDVYRGLVKPQPNLLGYLNYVAYLPQLVAGPIERYGHLYHQLEDLSRGALQSRWTAGLDRLALGVAEKLLIADSCGQIVDRLLYTSEPYTFFTAWTVAVGFGMQILFDFASYTHMAIGVSLMAGVRLSENFLSPYNAANVQEFWRRWHVTLSNWFRDYLYIPLGGSKGGAGRTFFNLLITFTLCGLWHGAGWNYLAWGTYHGFLLGIFNTRKRFAPNLEPPRYMGVALTFILVHVGWIMFRVTDPVQMGGLWQGMFGFSGFGLGQSGVSDMIFLGLVTAGALALPNASKRWPGSAGAWESILLWTLALAAVFSSPQINQFIYFQF